MWRNNVQLQCAVTTSNAHPFKATPVTRLPKKDKHGNGFTAPGPDSTRNWHVCSSTSHRGRHGWRRHCSIHRTEKGKPSDAEVGHLLRHFGGLSVALNIYHACTSTMLAATALPNKNRSGNVKQQQSQHQQIPGILKASGIIVPTRPELLSRHMLGA